MLGRGAAWVIDAAQNDAITTRRDDTTPRQREHRFVSMEVWPLFGFVCLQVSGKKTIPEAQDRGNGAPTKAFPPLHCRPKSSAYLEIIAPARPAISGLFSFRFRSFFNPYRSVSVWKSKVEVEIHHA
jgi:hypothetical protein